jgi:hypothetical protein
MKPKHFFALCAIPLVLTPGCQTSPWYDARYFPAPLEQEVHADAVPGSQMRTLATVLGIARADPKAGRPKQVQVRLRLENLGTVPARLVEEDLSLVSADLVPFEKAQLVPRDDLSIPVGQARQFDVAFPIDERELDWNSLTMRLTVMFQDKRVTSSLAFMRQVYAYDPYYWHAGVGYGYHW